MRERRIKIGHSFFGKVKRRIGVCMRIIMIGSLFRSKMIIII